MSRSSENAITTSVLALASGVLLGAVTALLLAPSAGTETRRKLSSLQGDATRKLKQYANDARFKARGGSAAADLHYDGGDGWI
ncbi:MAG: YtxH domain-containing protein [Trichlorobacter sp.]|jgi:gas vesicle protein